MRRKSRRFSVSLTPSAYERLNTIAEKHSPPLSLTFVVNSAIEEFLDKRKGANVRVKFVPSTERKPT